MKTVTIRDFRTRPAEARKSIAEESESLLTANGRPIALMISVDSESLEETMEAVKIGRAQTAMRGLREEARRRGLDQLTTDEIEALIADSRQHRPR